MTLLKDKILEFVKKEYSRPDYILEINYDTPLISSGIIDSLSMVSLVSFLETEYKIRIPSKKISLEAFDSVNNIVRLLKEFNLE